MKIILKVLLPCLLAVALPLRAAQAYVYFTRDALEEAFFPGLEVESIAWTPTADQRATLTTTLGYAPPQTSWEILVAREDGVAVGWAVLDAQRGQHEPIDFAVRVGPDGTVERVEILVYREAYGDGVRAPAFRSQFTGLGPRSPMRVGKEIQIVSGSTVSTRALAIGVRRAVTLVEVWRAGS